MPSCVYNVLIVDDEPAMLELTKDFLSEEGGLLVSTIGSGMGALELIQRSNFDVIVSDYQMPEMDGIGLLKALRERGDRIPFILFTGKGREEVAIEALNNGADFYIRKGTDVVAQFAELRNAIIHLAQMKGAEELIDGIFDTAPLMIMVVDEERRIQTLNKASLEFTTRSRRDLVGLRCGIAFECDNSKENEQGCGFSIRCKECNVWGTVLRTIKDGVKLQRVEAVIPSYYGRAGRDLDLLISSAPIWSFGKRLALVCVEDITELRERHRGSGRVEGAAEAGQ